MNETRNAAIVMIDKQTLLKMLDFAGGVIHRVFTPDDVLDPSGIGLVIEHPDLPEIPLGGVMLKITPILQAYYAEQGGIIKVERIEPPKKEGKCTG